MSGVAILGLACRLPDAPDRATFAENLVAGRASFGPVPPDRWDRAHHPVPPLAGFIADVDRFDHAYFGITAREARMMDPQQRLLLEETVHCMEDAGVPPAALREGRTSVFVAAMGYDYYQNVAGAPGAIESHGAVGVHLALLANRISHVFGLRGESLALDAACAGSLVALHQARRALLAGECDYALVAAANLNLNPWRLAAYGAGHLLSPGGGSAAFDAGADGFIPGEGVIVLLLRRLQPAMEAGQRVQAVLLGSAVGHVGGGVALTAPSIASQRDVIERAAVSAGVGLDSVGYIEAHGTGTSLGDPIEVEALNQAFATAPRGNCRVGSVKTNIGHLEGAAGLAGVAKVLTMLASRQMVPTLGLRTPNPLIDFQGGAMRPALAVEPWQPGSAGVRRAGVSSFGFGGAVAHAILEEAPEPAVTNQATGPAPVLLAAHTPAALTALWARWRGVAGASLDDLAGTLALGRGHGRYRLALVVQDTADLQRIVRGPMPEPAIAATPVVVVRAAGHVDVAAWRAALPHPAWIEAEGDAAAACAGWAPLGAPAPIDATALRRMQAGLATMDATAADALLAQARALAAGNHTFRAYLDEWQRVLGDRGSLASWLAEPPAGTQARLLVLVLLTALRRLSRKWALPAAHAALGPAWGEVAGLVVAGDLPDEAVPALIDGLGLDALASRVGRVATPDIVVLLGDAAPPAAGTTLVLQPRQSGLLDALAALWARGAAVAWGAVLGPYRTVPLPTYPFDDHRHWLPLPAAAPSPAAPSAAAPAADTASLAALHVIDGRALVPAAAMLATMGEGRAGLAAVSFLRPVPAGDAARLTLRRETGRATLTLDDQVVCASDTLEGPRPPAPPSHADPRIADPRTADPAVYERFEALGYHYAGPMRPILGVAASDDQVVCRVRCGGNPAVALEGALQACLVAADRWGLVTALVYPAALDRVSLGTAPDVFDVTVQRDALVAQPRGFTCDARSDGGGWLSIQGAHFAGPAAKPAPSAKPGPTAEAAPTAEPVLAPRLDVLALIRDAVAEAIDVPAAEVGDMTPFAELGVDSILAADVARLIGKGLGARVPLHVFSDHPTPEALAVHLGPQAAPGPTLIPVPLPPPPAAPVPPAPPPHTPRPQPSPSAHTAGPCAIIGMAGRFPGAPDLDAYWTLLRDGRSAIGPAPPGRWPSTHIPAGFLEDADAFDAAFFGISPREALLMDPQERILLEQTWIALADAGLAGGAGALQVGVYVGAAAGDYARLPSLRDATPDPHSLLTQLTSTLAARVAHVFDLHGPALVVDAACASSVAALQLACDALRHGEVDVAIAAGVTIMSTPAMAEMARAAGLLSPSGISRALCAHADGMVLGEGAGVVVLRRAEEVHGPAYAVIAAALMRHDGARLGLSAPSAAGQARLQRAALAAAGLTPDQLGYVETHGVGTPGGDAAELAALADVMGNQPVPLGAVKNAIGHTQSAAGMASLFKVVLQLRHDTLAATIGQGVGSAEGAASAVTTARPWHGPRLALINTFALNGSNGAVLVQPVAAPPRASPPDRPALVTLGAHTEPALRRRMSALATWIEGRTLAVSDLALTLATEPPMPWRAVAVADDAAALAGLWRAAGQGEAPPGVRIGQAQRRTPAAQAVMDRLATELLAQPDAPGALLAAAELLVGGVTARAPTPPGAARLLGLPPYPFERVRHWPEPIGTPARPTPVATTPEPAPEPAPKPAPEPAPDLAACVARVLRMDTVPIDVPLLSLGLDSLLAQELRHAAVTALGIDIPAADWMQADLRTLAARAPTAPRVTAPTPVANPAARHAPFPLTDMQAAYLVGRSPAMPLGGPCLAYWEFAIPADWTASRLEQTFAHLVGLHDMLRAVIDPDGRQRILPDAPRLPVPAHDWRGMDPTPQAELRRAFAEQGFDPAIWPLVRIAVSRDDGGQRLHLAMDLMFVDMPSLVLLLRQWAALMQGGPVPPRPALSFRDAALARRDDPAAAAYWAQQTILPGPTLHGQKTIEAGTAWHPTRLSAHLPPAAWRGLCAQAATAGVTPTAALVAAFGEVLAHWALDPRFTLNLTAIDRAPAVADLVGDFTGTVLLGLDHTAPLPFASRAQGVRDRLGAHLAQAGHSGVRVLRDLSQARRAAVPMPVVFTSMLGHAGLESMGRLVGGVTRTPQVWLDCHVRESEGGLVINWDAIEGLFPSGMLAAMLRAYADGLTHLAQGGWDTALGAWLAAEQAARRAQANATAAPLPPGLLHEALLAHAAATPDRVAVIDAAGPHTYGKIVGLAAAIAARIDVRPDELVAVAMPRGWHQVAALLGVLMAGGAYLPIDPALPPARVRSLLDRGRARTVLTLDAAGDWPAGVEALAVAPLPPGAAPPPRASAANLAYVLFTSGSTGEPKGVMIEHRSALNTVLDVNARFGVGPGDRVLALSSASFDLSVWDLFGVLGAGGTMVMPDDARLADPAYLAGLVAAHAVTIWNAVPAFAQLLMAADPAPRDLASLRLVMMSGDWIPPALPDRLRAACPNLRVVGLGGATEASIWSVWHDAGPRDPAWGSVPYGRPLQNQTCHVLDAALADLPDWTPGELYIGGAGVARGYFGDPARTAERFLRHPRTDEPLYRTGDLARYREAGLLEFLGRADHQVKLGGHRVELGEVEAALARHPLVATAAAVAPFDGPARRLVAFCVAAPGTAASGAEIQRFVRALLPAYMVPAEIRLLPALPLGAQAKIDRRALEALAAAPDKRAEPPVPQDTEGRVLAIWRAVLGNPALPPDGNLFEHGATSFKAVEACARLTREVAPCTVTDVFEFPTARTLAARLAGAAPVIDDRASRADRRRAFRAALQGGA